MKSTTQYKNPISIYIKIYEINSEARIIHKTKVPVFITTYYSFLINYTLIKYIITA